MAVQCFTLVKASLWVGFSDSLVRVMVGSDSSGDSVDKTWIMRRLQLKGMRLICSHLSLCLCTCESVLAYKYDTFRGIGITRKLREGRVE